MAKTQIPAGYIAANAITATEIATNSITAAAIASDAIVVADIADNSITSAKIAADAVGSSEIATLTDHLRFSDDVKATFGASNDLQIYHVGDSSSYIATYSGNLIIQSTLDDQDVLIKSDDGSGGLANYIQADGSNGEVRLYHYGTEKFNTLSTGVEVTGNITVSGTVDGRDIATDGTKLDGIEANATADQTQSEINALGITATGLSGTPNITVGTISSGAITAGTTSSAANVRAHDGAGNYATMQGYGIDFNRSASYLRPATDGTMSLYVGGADDTLDWNTIYFRSNNGLVLNGTQFISAGGNLTNIGTIGSGAITSTGAIQGASFSDGTISGITFIDEDSFATNSATRVPTQQSIKAYVDAQVAGVVDSAPAALDTLNELAAALGDDANFSTTTSTALGNRLRVDTAAQGLTGTQQANAITNLGITATKAELNVLDGITSTVTELNYTDGVTSNIQTQLDTKLASSSYTAADVLTKIKTVDGTGSGLDADTLDGVEATGFLYRDVTNSGYNINLTTDAGAAAGLYVENSANAFRFQLYGDGSNYGFLDSKWGAWDLQKAIGGNLKVDHAGTLYTVWDAYNDGAGSGLDADLLDGQHGSYYAPASTALTTSTTFGGDVSGAYNAIVIADDSHNHIISNVDGLQTALDAKLASSSYTAADVLTKIKTVDGAGSGLDADLLDGISSASFLRSDTDDAITNTAVEISFYSADVMETATSDQATLEVYQDTAGADAFMQFHIGGDYAGYFGLKGDINDFAVGGWSYGATYHRIWHAGNDGAGSGLDADTLDGVQAASFAQLTGATFTGEVNINARLDIGAPGNDHEIRIYKTDNNVSDHIQFYNGTTRVGEIGCEDTTWLRINQETVKNIYTPRYIRADDGFYVDGTTKGINGSGNFIGGTIAGASDYSTLLRSNANDTATGIITFSNTTASTSKTTGAVIVTGGVGISGALNVGGDVTAFASSDERLKDNLTQIKNPIEKINQIGGYEFDWNDKQDLHKGHDIGVVAQEIEKVLPEIVTDRDDGYKAVKYEKLVALLIEGMKEQQKQIEELKERVNK